MIYSVSGAQGSGKTTILNELSKQGYNVISRKTARSVLKEWQLTLPEIYNNNTLMRKFQLELVERKRLDEEDKIMSSDIWFTDRSYVDLLTYSSIILGPKQENAEWLDEYYQKCKEYQKHYQKVFYIEPLPFVVSDGTRNTSIIYSDIVDTIIQRFLKKFNASKTETVSKIENKDRVQEILKKL